MVLLKNIKKTDTDISAEYYPEGRENERGFMRLRLSDGEVIEHDKSCCVSAAHVRRKLERLIEYQGEMPEETKVYWY